MGLQLFSDGGGVKEASAAGACIIENEQGLRAQCIVYLGSATNNEAEISAGLLGFSFIRAAKLSTKEVCWIADSEYALKSATGYIHAWQKNGWKTAAKKPVKNQGLWQSYLALTKGLKITPEHVRGHTGHPENEAVDSASTWAQRYAEDVLDSEGEGCWVEPFNDGTRWFLIDGREFLENLRSEGIADVETDDLLVLSACMKEKGATSFEVFQEQSTSKRREKPTNSKEAERLVETLQEIQSELRSLSSPTPKTEALAKGLATLLKKYRAT